MTVGVTYQTTPEQMEELLARLRKLIGTDPDINQEMHLIRFTGTHWEPERVRHDSSRASSWQCVRVVARQLEGF
jgi:hypothetical protein